MQEKKTTDFFKEDENPWEAVAEGISRQITGFNTDLMMVKVKFKKGAIGYQHQHIHSQSSFVASGKFEITIGGKTEILTTGDTFFVQPNIIHGAKCIEDGVLVDVFNPAREDFLSE
ncbi:cupin domain-containing protein [Galbibacter sp. PAP.153]|uniref:cupin domain-containing protein n=1 Tax=Galbibacter sp. PAP.153 TaxID=3104623 RepID=UPI00300ACAE3